MRYDHTGTTQAVWIRLRNTLLFAKAKLKNSTEDAALLPQPKTIEEFLISVKKGSKKFRNIIDKSVYCSVDVSECTAIRTFCEINCKVPPPLVIVEHFLASWNVSFLDNNLREFIFKCRFNLLKTNDRLAHVLTSIDQT